MTDESILNKIKSPSDLKTLSTDEQYDLAGEIRDVIVKTVSENGGHLASNLGVVELTIAIHSVFDSPKDKIVWDVGHQSYTHKILTGRYEKLSTIRTENGLSGFPKRSESEHDAFDTGHSSTSVSAAFGIACAGDINGEKYYTVAVIGDGALSGGLALEAINNAGRSKEKLIVILNDNKMSISKNVGSMARYLTRLRIRPSYVNAKVKVKHKLGRLRVFGRQLAHMFSVTKNWLKVNLFGQQKTIFELFGFNYYGPLDGHDIDQLKSAMMAAKHSRRPVLLYVCTTKGRGYEYAEKNPKDYHGVSAFDVETGEPISSSTGYSDIFGETMCSFAKSDKSICAITAAMAMGTGLANFSKKYKNRFYDVGIAEEHAVTFACGLAAGNIIPVFAVYSTFLQRSYDQILHDAALQKLHIVLAIDRAGIVGEDGETHQGIFDAAFLNTIPGVTLYSPSSFAELREMLYTAVYSTPSVAAVRYPRGSELYLPDGYEYKGEDFSLVGDKDAKILVVTYGRIFSYACRAAESLSEQGKDVCILKLNKVIPLSEDMILAAKKYDKVFFFEEGIRHGGIGETFGLMLYQSGFSGSYKLTAIDNYVKQAKCAAALHYLKLDAEGIEDVIQKDCDKFFV